MVLSKIYYSAKAKFTMRERRIFLFNSYKKDLQRKNAAKLCANNSHSHPSAKFTIF